jgi:hypothetical protein
MLLTMKMMRIQEMMSALQIEKCSRLYVSFEVIQEVPRYVFMMDPYGKLRIYLELALLSL